MPLYDYRCTDCGREVEVMHGINDTGPSTCQHCGGAMRKALSPPAIHFKGSGWAKKDAASASAKKTTTKPAAAGDKDSSKGEVKPAAASDAKGDSASSTTKGSGTDSKAASSSGSKAD